MTDKYSKEIIKIKSQRDKSILGEVSLIFDVIRGKTKDLAMDITSKAGENTEYFQERNRAETFATKINTELRPDYLKKDNFSKQVYAEEYRTAYLQSLYTTVNTGLDNGFDVKLPRYTAKQFKKAVNYPLSKLQNTAKMKTARSADIEQLYTTIVSGVESGLSLPNINKNLDIAMGYRDAQTGRLIVDKAKYKGMQYKTNRVLRTEVLRMRSVAETDQWLNQQPIVESDLMLIEVLDNRTRSQSANMDGQISNKEGKFKFPGIDEPKYAHRSGRAAYDINDRSTTITIDPDFPPESRIERDPITGKNKVVPFKNFEQYAKDNNLTKNKYGEYLFDNKPIAKIKTPKTKIKTPVQKVITRPSTASKTPTTIKKATPKINDDIEKLRQKKSVYSMANSQRIADEFNVTLDTVLRVESEFIKKSPRKVLNIDNLRGLVVDDMTKEINRLKRQISSLG